MDPSHTTMLNNAIKYATRMHHGQKRKNTRGDDYITHPLEVMQYLKDHGVTDEDVLVCAVLHHVVKDTPSTYDSLLLLFGERVVNMIQEVTDDKSLPKLERKMLQVGGVGVKSLGARLVKIGDKWSNTRKLLEDAPVGWTTVQINGYIMWSEHVCRNACKPGDVPPELRKDIVRHFDDLGAYDMDDEVLQAYYDSMRE